MEKKNVKHWLGGTLALLYASLSFAESSAPQENPQRPNIIFILTDDHRYDAMGFIGDYPWLQTPNLDRMAAEGAWFKNAFVTTSVCAPSRASFLTGLYAHNHGVGSNQDVREPNWMKTPSFGQYLHERGYRTGYIGKWHMYHHNRNRPGWDFWASFSDQGKYHGNQMMVNGAPVFEEGYVTDVLTRYATEFLEADVERPFLLYLSHKAVHAPFTPAERHEDLYRGIQLPETPNRVYNLSGKPEWQKRLSPGPSIFLNRELIESRKKRLTGPIAEGYANQFFNNMRSLKAVDASVGAIMDTLEKTGRLDNTLIVYAGDNGFLFGEHRRGDKRLAYEESIRIPFLMRWPGEIPAGRVVKKPVLNVDLAPTLLDLAGCGTPKPSMDGMSMRPLFKNENAPWRSGFLYSYFRDLQPIIPTLVAYRTDRYKLVKSLFRAGDLQHELYDLKRDPYELENRYDHLEYSEIIDKMKQAMREEEKSLNFTPFIPDPNPGRFETTSDGTLFNYRNTESSRQDGSLFASESQVEFPPRRELHFTEPAYRIRTEFTAKRDGVIVSQGNKIMGYILAVLDGRVRFILFRGQHRYILESEHSILERPCEVVATFDNETKVATLAVNGAERQFTQIANTYPRDFHPPRGALVLGRPLNRFEDLDRVGLTGESFTGKLKDLVIERSSTPSSKPKKKTPSN